MTEVTKVTDGCDEAKAIKPITTPAPQAGDAKIFRQMTRPSDACRNVLPAAQLQSDEKLLEQLYARAIPDANRQMIFYDRMKFIENYDPELFKKMVDIGQNIKNNKPAAVIGKEIAEAVQGTVERHPDGNRPPDFTSKEFMTVLGGLSGLMLAERPANHDLIDAVEKQLSAGNNEGIAAANGAKMQLHAISWADNGEPALSAYTDSSIDRYHFVFPSGNLQSGAAVITSPAQLKKP